MDARETIAQAEKAADKIADERYPGATKPCPRCKGTNIYHFVSGATGDCASCDGGRVPADAKAGLAFRMDRELRRLRCLYRGYKSALLLNPSKRVADDAIAFLATLERRAAAVKADPRVS